MNEQYIREESKPSDFVERTAKDANSPIVNSDPFADKVPVDAALIHETPMGGTVAAVGPLNEPVSEEVPMYETPDQEIPMGGTVAAVGPLDATIVQETPMGQKIPYMSPVRETNVDQFEVPDKAPVGETITHPAPDSIIAAAPAALFTREESEHFRTRWNEIQGQFVDEPRSAVQQADALVSEVIEKITQMFTNEHRSLEGQWKQGKDVSTEDFRVALQHYRSFFKRLVI